ncbi:MAG: hypothetical protein K5872_06590 [Rhizobiaceae bacterium]|nr:hypothetical protein [Rhizobiaceae bacterium]MCV0405880.1 hypothetical protein [Rhizobiaceae bacterium]
MAVDDIGSAIPTIADHADSVCGHLIDAALRGISPEVAEAVADVFTSDPMDAVEPDTAIMNLIMYAGACHEAAKVLAEIGQSDDADLFHAMGQDMLAKALDGLGHLISRGADFLGAKH